jgi:hypothetical protein
VAVSLSDWLLVAMLVWNPPSEHAFTGETYDGAVGRYRALATLAAETALSEAPLPGLTRENGALLQVSVGSFESGGWAADVERCARGGDSGRSWTVWGLWGPKARVCADPRLAAQTAYDRLRTSLERCASLPAEHRLAAYASGSCGRGRLESAHRWHRFTEWVAAHPFPTAGAR